MPEGDTIFRTARTLGRALTGRVVTRFETQLPKLARIDEDTPLAGRTVERVEATGKWLFIYFSGDLMLLTHMLMSGSWHIYRLGEPWQRPRVQMRAAIYTEPYVAVAFQVPIAEFHTAATLARRRNVRDLGPDVLAGTFDAAATMAQLRSRPDLEIGVALLTQSLLAGLGNIFKSEVCFAARVHPFRTVGTLSIEELSSLVANARKLLNASAVTGRLQPAVYRRNGEPCRICGTAILSRKQGLDARTTFWCPECQPEMRSKVAP